MSPIRYLRQLVAPHGRHRAVAAPTGGRTDDLLGPWPPAVPERTHGAAVVQSWEDCPHCDKATAGVLHRDGWTCGECLNTVTPEGAS
ncbi:hypothetical protein AB0N17_03330 [Streptomyces sp. NPDC051133]|uniref:hypothetical protein n=1 Tax=Streptomyces sp. NPDC051133 TaxID=3155521 RepID=UPI00343088DE